MMPCLFHNWGQWEDAPPVKVRNTMSMSFSPTTITTETEKRTQVRRCHRCNITKVRQA